MATIPEPLARVAIPEPVRLVLEGLARLGQAAFIVGGAVRDPFLGKAPHEWDVATSALPEEVVGAFPKVVPTGLQHGTVTVVVDHHPIEVTTFRGEGAYQDGRRPTSVTFLRDVREDLARRDFTVNALAWDPVRGLFEDPFGGVADLRAKTIRAVGDARVRFGEDGLRIMRAARFASVLGFRLERATRRAIPGALATFEKVAVERVQAELTKILVGPRPRYGFELLRRTGVLGRVLPELLEGFGMRQNRWHRYDVYHHVLRSVDAAPPRLGVRLATLLHDVDKPRTAAPRPGGEPWEKTFYDHERSGAERAREICLRLRYPNKLADEVAVLVREHQFVYSDEWSDGAVRRMLARVGEERWEALLAVRVADTRGRGRAVEEGLAEHERLAERVRRLVAARPALTARDLALRGQEVMEALGTGPGPQVGEAVKWLVEQVLDDPSRNTREGLLALLAARKAAPRL